MKRCSKCGQPKPLSEFYADARASDGKQSQCKRCMNDKAAAYNRRHAEQSRVYVRASKARAASKVATAARQRLGRALYPAKPRAHKAVARALRSGILTRPGHCECCGLICEPQAHHNDYSKPLLVRWLCPGCHSDADARRPRIHL